jgi:hypothetical protein
MTLSITIKTDSRSATVSTERNNRAVVIGRTPVGSCRSKPIGTLYPRVTRLRAALLCGPSLTAEALAGRATGYDCPSGLFSQPGTLR